MYPTKDAPVAQLVEHRTFNPLVVGSIPTGRTVDIVGAHANRSPLAVIPPIIPCDWITAVNLAVVRPSLPVTTQNRASGKA